MCEARNFAACVDEICGAGREIWGARLEGEFRATRRRSKICSVKYDAEFCSAVCRDKIFSTALAGTGNFELQNARVNFRPRNTYADLKFKGSTHSEPAGGLNFKFKNGASFRFLCGGNAKSLKSRALANALNSSGANKILVSVWTGRILSSSAEAGILASSLANEILNPSAAGEILKSNAASKILSLGAASRTDFGPKGAGGC